MRSPEEYAEGHVEGAINIPLADLEARLGDVPMGTEVVPYCNMYHPGNSRGEQAAAMLVKLGFGAKALLGGFPAWRDAGLPIEAGVVRPSEGKDD